MSTVGAGNDHTLLLLMLLVLLQVLTFVEMASILLGTRLLQVSMGGVVISCVMHDGW